MLVAAGAFFLGDARGYSAAQARFHAVTATFLGDERLLPTCETAWRDAESRPDFDLSRDPYAE